MSQPKRRPKVQHDRMPDNRHASLPASPSVRAEIERAYRTGKVRLRVWLDEAGDVCRFQVLSNTGDDTLDSIIRDEVIAGILQPTPEPDPTKCITSEVLGD